MYPIKIETTSTSLIIVENQFETAVGERYTLTLNRSAIVDLIFALESAICRHGWNKNEALLILQLEQIIHS